jgi:hypothetical protein
MPDPLDIARQWIELVLTDLEAVIYTEQSDADAPRPATPYAAIHILSDGPNNWQTPNVWTEDTGASSPPAKFPQHLAWTREGQLMVELLGAGSVDRLRLLQLTLARQDVIALLKSEAVAIRQGVTVTRSPELLSTTWEEQAAASFVISWVDEISSDVDVIEVLDFTVSEA